MTSYTVYRMEHTGCSYGNPHHGPHMMAGPDCWSEKPNFGECGPTPAADHPNTFMRQDEICGVLPEQVRTWWSDRERPWAFDPIRGWDFAVYEVPAKHTKVLARQVVFVKDKAKFLGYYPEWVDRTGQLNPTGMFRDPVPDPPSLSKDDDAETLPQSNPWPSVRTPAPRESGISPYPIYAPRTEDLGRNPKISVF